MVAGHVVLAVLLGGCRGTPEPAPAAVSTERPSILLVTLDTTRADAIGPDAKGIETKAFNALAARGRRFSQAYATVPETLPSHISMLTGLYPAGHGVHQNARSLTGDHAVVAERLRQAGYRTAACVSSFVLARRFGLARGFDVYDDELSEGSAERTSRQTTDRALAQLDLESRRPLFLWVHYYDPHTPYAPPEPFASRYTNNPYLGEVAAMDEQLGRLVEGFERRAPGASAIVIVADHGEGLGDHGESQHGNLLYQSTMHVPLVMVGPGMAPGVSAAPVSTRRIFHTLLDWAGLGSADSLRGRAAELVLGEAMKPFLDYGWQPQVMAIEGRRKAIQAGELEVYDVAEDAAESRNLAATADLSRSLRTAVREYPTPSLAAQRAPDTLSAEDRQKLASLGYVSAGAAPLVRKGAPRPVAMTRLFESIEQASNLFVSERYSEVIPLLQKIVSEDPGNLAALLRLATAHSALGHEVQAIQAFEKARELAPESQDVRTYLGLHYARGKEWRRAEPLLARVVAETPDRLPALEALAVIRERQARNEDAVDLRQRIYALREPSPPELVRLGQLAMSLGRTPLALGSFEKARDRQGKGFAHDLELGALYLAARRFEDARAALDRVPASDPGYPMALFKRAQASVLLGEPDRARRIQLARERADSTTRPLIEKERLFQGAAAR